MTAVVVENKLWCLCQLSVVQEGVVTFHRVGVWRVKDGGQGTLVKMQRSDCFSDTKEPRV